MSVVESGIPEEALAELARVLGPDHLITSKPARMHRARVPAPFPVHRWADHLPDAVVLPASTEEVAEIVRIANRHRIPVVPRSGGTGLTDGAVPLRHGILLDLKRLDRIHEIDLENRTCTVGAGVNMLKLNEQLARHGLIYPDDPASYPCSLVGGRIGTSGWSLIGSRYGHTRDLVLSFVHVLPTGEVIRLGDGGGGKLAKSSTGYTLKPLFMGHQGTLGVATEATLKLYPKPEAELSPFWSFDDYETAHRALREIVRTDCATFAGAVLFDEKKVAYLRRDDEAYIPQPADVRALVCAVLYGNEDEVRAGGKRLMKAAQGERRALPRRRDLPGRLGRAPRPLRHPAPRPHEGRPGRADELALRGRRGQLDRAPRRQPQVARHRRAAARALGRVRRLGHVRLHERAHRRQLPHRDRRRHLGAGARRRDVGDVGRGQARHRARRRRARRLDQLLSRRLPRGRGRHRARSSSAAATT